jgi:HK97 gp10 family phage protein
MTLVSRLPSIARNLKRDVPAALQHEAAPVIIATARARIHNRSHELASSLHAEHTDHGVTIIADARDPKGTPYGKFVELGTHHASPHPFLIPALMANKATVERAADAGIKEACA